ncbi:unnamed protein product [Wuchereria bancrofti]|uniref:Uncharacterized protein n=1 Tax=Wuchereria bancrofti TaxID=6293 RepID=A0A3P7G288_WUCBA|nr:unnamed protein product [Wuchereria bancrofti]
MTIIYGMIINLFGCFFVFSVSGAAVNLMFPMSVGKGCKHICFIKLLSKLIACKIFDLVAILWKHGENIYFIVLSLLFPKTSFGAILASLTFFSLFLCTIGTKNVEMIIMSVYRAVIRIKFID